tara:strand:- start:1268 stop:1801 length:534 start_codon:yes stop_codon:yes gene_type:complete
MAMDQPDPVAWCIGRHFPFSHREVFPHGIEGVDIVDEPIGKRLGFLWNRGKTDIAKMQECARQLFDAMDLPTVPKRDLGVHFRGRRADGKSLADFEDEILSAMAETTGEIATLCDSMRWPISQILGERMIPQTTHEMTHDMDREDLDVRAFLVEWWSLLNCQRIITNCPNSSIVINF